MKPSLTMQASQRIDAPAARKARATMAMAGVNDTSAASPTMLVAWIIRTTTTSYSGSKREKSAAAPMDKNKFLNIILKDF